MFFEEKREVELVWNGKSNEIRNIMLPFQTIEQVEKAIIGRLHVNVFISDDKWQRAKTAREN